MTPPAPLFRYRGPARLLSTFFFMIPTVSSSLFPSIFSQLTVSLLLSLTFSYPYPLIFWRLHCSSHQLSVIFIQCLSYFPFTPHLWSQIGTTNFLRSTNPVRALFFLLYISGSSDTKVQGLPFELLLITHFTSNRSAATAAYFDRATLYSFCVDESNYCHMHSNLDFPSL